MNTERQQGAFTNISPKFQLVLHHLRRPPAPRKIIIDRKLFFLFLDILYLQRTRARIAILRRHYRRAVVRLPHRGRLLSELLTRTSVALLDNFYVRNSFTLFRWTL